MRGRLEDRGDERKGRLKDRGDEREIGGLRRGKGD